VIAKEKKTCSYLPVMCANLLKEASKEFMKKIKPVSSKQNPKKVVPTIASLPAPSTSELVKEHMSRF
jgi:hypothetical protein